MRGDSAGQRRETATHAEALGVWRRVPSHNGACAVALRRIQACCQGKYGGTMRGTVACKRCQHSVEFQDGS
jgi:hypothetical protein